MFPVFVGQTQYAFNGAIHPIRTAPECQYLAVGIDWITGHRLSFQVLLNLTAWVSLTFGLVTAYLSLVWLSPRHRWRALALAVAYVASPGVLGLPYAQDLYMSTTAVPWLPVVFAALVQTCRLTGWVAPLVLGASVGATWWAHSPIALWSTLAVFAVLGVRGLQALRVRSEWGRFAGSGATAAAALAAVGSYPFVSVLTLRVAGERVVPTLFPRERLLAEVQGAFPGTLLPLKLDAPLLTFIQPGYTILVVLLAAATLSFWAAPERRRIIQTLIAVCLVYLVLILPMPGITAWLWQHLPTMWVAMTNLWPMQRFCVVIAGASVVALQQVLSDIGERDSKRREVVRVLLFAGVAWTLYEADALRTLARQRLQPAEAVAQVAREENVNVSAYCYQQLPHRPSYFIHGVADPRMEMRLLSPETGAVIASNKRAAEAASTEPWFDLQTVRTANPGVLRLGQLLQLNPGIRYLVTFEFSRSDLRGILRFVGPGMQRVYVLPSAGDAKGFGAGPDQEKSLVLWTSLAELESVQMEFIPDAGAGPAPRSLGRARLAAIDPHRLPVEVESLTPLTMTVRSPAPSRLETVRVFVPGWRARVNGQAVPVSRSGEGLLTIEVPAGESQVVAEYVGSVLLRSAFWLNLVSAAGIVLGLPALAWRTRRASW
ncbi:hypothetical protein DB347_11385 [Opitutaceae bacterium EW11]|nr:hypothetical protein DB347_11385 [Opitutaceae bacterium EW11]